MTGKDKIYIAAIAAGSLLITALHFLLFEQEAPFVVLEELYYIPLLVGAIRFGMKGAVGCWLIVTVSYLPFLSGVWTTGALGILDRALHILFSGVFAFLAGFFVDRLKRQQREIEKNRYLSNLGQVAATIVHDLKNPLISILGFAKRISQGKGDVGAAADSIIESAGNMQRIVTNVLDFSKPVKLEFRTQDVRHVLEQLVESCRAKAEERGVGLALEMPDQPLLLTVDAFNLQRALANIVNNAVEASGSGQEVALSLRDKKQHVVISVEDHGSGMDSDTVEHIFFPFYSKKSSGTGLGMAIAKKIIDGHQGSILVKSKQGEGTIVEIELPKENLSGSLKTRGLPR
jgi:signal transduction histidine kinase